MAVLSYTLNIRPHLEISTDRRVAELRISANELAIYRLTHLNPPADENRHYRREQAFLL